MKKNIHPTYYPNAQVVCACGNTFTTGSTLPEIRSEVCSACHPFYTGEMKYLDTMGRVEKFQRRQKEAEKVQEKLFEKKKKEEERKKKRAEAPKTLREMLLGK